MIKNDLFLYSRNQFLPLLMVVRILVFSVFYKRKIFSALIFYENILHSEEALIFFPVNE